MLPDVLLGGLEKLRHVLLRKPDRLALEPHINFQFPVLGLVNEELAAGSGDGLASSVMDGLQFGYSQSFLTLVKSSSSFSSTVMLLSTPAKSSAMYL